MSASYEDIALAALLKRIDECRGGRLEKSIRALKATSRLYSVNAQELRESLEDFNRHPLILLWNADKRELFDEYYREVVRLFHNFLAAAKTLVDQARVFVARNYEHDGFASEYQEKIRETFTKSTLASFVHDLRNYMLHVGLPPTKASIGFNSGSQGSQVTSAIYLKVEALREWTRWSANAKLFLDELASDPNLLEIVNSYNTLTDSFYEWLSRRINEMHSADFAELDSLYIELKNYRPQAGAEKNDSEPMHRQEGDLF